MKRLLSILALLIPLLAQSQVNCTSRSGQNVQTILENYFIGGGVEISNVRFNGQLVANSNQFGTFTNSDTSGMNVKLSSGIVIVTGDVQDAAQGASAIHSSNSIPLNNDDVVGSPKAVPLRLLLNQLGFPQAMFDIGELTFDFVPQGNEISFKYVFASDEYPQYVNSTFNDAFGFFVTGPFASDGISPITVPGYLPISNYNIAIIPGTDPEQPVTINTVNSGNPIGTSSSNSPLHIQLTGGSINKMQGYTIALETKRIIVAPCYKYSISIAICDVSDGSYNSAVYLGANSFKTDAVNLSGAAAGPSSGDTLIKAECSSTTITAKLNRPANEYDSYTFQVGGDMVENIDYHPFGNQLTFPVGDSIAQVMINFISHQSDVPGQLKTLYIITENTTPCSVKDTIKIKAVVPQNFEFSYVRNDTVYCNDVLPQRELLSAEAINGIGNTTYLWTGPDGQPIGETPTSNLNYVIITEPITITITANDECFRQISKTVNFRINTGSTEVSTDSDKICEGDSIQLSCTNAVTCIWTSIPSDLKLAQNNTSINPIAMPSGQTTYKVTINDMYGCQAKGQITITAYPNVDAKMSLNPNNLTYTNTETQFINLTSNSHSVLWNFGDGTTSTENNGYHTYPNNEAKEYEVILVAYNEALCPDTAKGKIIVKPDFTIFLPNAITPGTGNLNSIFLPLSSIPIEYELSIFNRWGENIFTTNNKIGGGWNGKLKDGSYAQDGTYVWYLTYKDGDGLNQKKKGNVSVIGSPK
ncbi:MAG: choice-of-anchor L domain-containing protein [Bacteroidales bacterium]|nr:choice-of-anchor L domain-containing protein [Bacteroidales bacterium]